MWTNHDGYVCSCPLRNTEIFTGNWGAADQRSVEDCKPDKIDVILSHGEELSLFISSGECTKWFTLLLFRVFKACDDMILFPSSISHHQWEQVYFIEFCPSVSWDHEGRWHAAVPYRRRLSGLLINWERHRAERGCWGAWIPSWRPLITFPE